MPSHTEILDAAGGWPGILTRLVDGEDLASEVAGAAVAEILAGDVSPARIAAFLVGLRAKGESASELAGMLDAVMADAVRVPLAEDLRDAAVDVVGTGGDRSHSINVSTMAALVTAGAGVPVCKHGNRAASSSCGTADVLEALGVTIELSPAGVASCVEEAGIGFCFAPAFHPAFRHAGPVRREIGVRTAFNLLGPMANPAGVRRQLIGVADPAVADVMVHTLAARGSTHAWVVHGSGLDELSTTGPSTVTELLDGAISRHEVDPVRWGLERVDAAALVGGGPEVNAAVVRAVLDGEPGPHRDIVVLNAGAALVVAGRVDDLGAGLAAAGESIDSGRAAAALDRLVEVSGRVAGGTR
ncbi:MAG: anthranilate phosphoribosyltransferase [Actinomycetota bacterium]|jgi:anthranilate phosphoribosyltransferase